MKKVFIAILLGGVAFGLAGCNTMRGVGKDIQQAGEGIQRAVR